MYKLFTNKTALYSIFNNTNNLPASLKHILLEHYHMIYKARYYYSITLQNL